ncbi:MAG: polyprenyl synthetase family protein [Candidatus Thorarchaeota archaeon]
MSNFEEIWNEELDNVNKALSHYFDYKINQASRLGDWHTQFYGYMKEYLMRGGKRLRPVLVAIGYKSIKDDIDIKYLYRAANSIEILHNGSLLHDDLIDHDETRRGGKTFHVTYRDLFLERTKNKEKSEDLGSTMAILGGDLLLNMGAQAINDSELPQNLAAACLKHYQDAFQSLADGVMLEMTMIDRDDITPEIYLEMIALKTAVLFDKSLVMGALLAGANESQITALSEYGVKVGQAFQIQDDVLGSFGDEAVTGKSADGDIHEGKKTMIVLNAYKLATTEQKKLLDDLLGKHNMNDNEVNTVRNVFIESGALDETRKMMNELLLEGQAALEKASPGLKPKYKEFLLALSEFLVKREY